MAFEAPLGTEAVESSTAAPDTSASPSPGSDGTSQPVSFTDDTLFTPPGAKAPVKYGEWYRGLQSRLTKASQEAAEYKRAQAEQARQIEAAKDQLARYEAYIRNQQTTQAGSPLDKYKTLPYLTGEDAYSLAEQLKQEYGVYGQELSKRDQILTILAQELLNLKQGFGSVQNERASASFETKIGNWVKELGLPPEANDLAKEIYLAYEGPDLDAEFPSILRNRWEGLQKLFRQTESKRIAEARQRPFVPGKGGEATTAKPLDIKPNATSREIAEMLFPLLQGSET